MPTVLAWIDTPAPEERHREAVPSHAVFAQASIPAIDSDVQKMYIGTPDPEADLQAHKDWARVKRVYENEAQDPNGNVTGTLEVEVVPEMDPDPEPPEPQDQLQEVVGTRQANALQDAGYGTLPAAQALAKEALLEIDGVGETTFQKLQDA